MWHRSVLTALTRRPFRGSPPRRARLAVEPLDDRRTPTANLGIGDVTVLEGNDGTRTAVVAVSVTGRQSNAITVNYGTADGTAKAGRDYTPVSGTLTFAVNERTKTISVPILGDRLPEPNETFSVRLADAKGARIADGVGSVAVVDDEPRVSVSDPYAWEGNAGGTPLTFTVSLDRSYDLPVTVTYATADGPAVAGSDYAAAAGTLTFAPGETSKTLTVLVTGDRLPEPDEGFSVTATSPDSYAWVIKGAGRGTIWDDEPGLSVFAASSGGPPSDVAYAWEGNAGGTPLTFGVSLSSTYDLPVTVTYATADRTATAGADYAAAAGTLTFAPGERSKAVTVLVTGDRVPEPDEGFSVTVTSPDYARVTRGVAWGTIWDDEPQVSVSDAYSSDANAATQFTFTVSLFMPYDEVVTVDFATADGTAVAGVDYVAAAGTLTFAPGETTKTITVEVLDPTLDPDKYLSVLLSGASANAGIGDGVGVGWWWYYYDDGSGGWDYGIAP